MPGVAAILVVKFSSAAPSPWLLLQEMTGGPQLQRRVASRVDTHKRKKCLNVVVWTSEIQLWMKPTGPWILKYALAFFYKQKEKKKKDKKIETGAKVGSSVIWIDKSSA